MCSFVYYTCHKYTVKGKHTLHYINVRYCKSLCLQFQIFFFLIQGMLKTAPPKPRGTMCHVYDNNSLGYSIREHYGDLRILLLYLFILSVK